MDNFYQTHHIENTHFKGPNVKQDNLLDDAQESEYSVGLFVTESEDVEDRDKAVSEYQEDEGLYFFCLRV